MHWTLAEGLRALGHEVTVASDGDDWKNYPRDIDLRRNGTGRAASLAFGLRLLRALPRLRGYDVVQLINPVFLPLRAERIYRIYRYLRRHNGAVFMGAFGMDHFWVRAGLDCRTFRYSDFNLGTEVRRRADNDVWIADWLHGEKGRLNRYVADDCNGIVAGLYEYHASYRPHYREKLAFIPFPIRLPETSISLVAPVERVRFFIGIQRTRSSYKGTDLMLRALERAQERYPQEVEVRRVVSVPFEEYRRLLLGSHVLLDQLYSYTPAMNALEAMAQGLVVVGGGEPENYELLGERTLRPIINVEPNEESVYRALCNLVEHKEDLPRLSRESRLYIERHHEYRRVAQRYLDFWSERLI